MELPIKIMKNKKLSEITGLLPLGRNYSLVIAGKEGNYYTLVQQEY